MQKSKDSIFQSLGLFSFTLSIIVLIAVSGCENPGPVGSGLTNSGADIVVDTLTLAGLDTMRVNTYAGGRSYFSAGQYNDALFGNMSSIGMLEPLMPSAADTLHSGDKMMLRIILNGAQVYGDSTASQDFDIYEINEYWKGSDRRVKDGIKIDMNEKVGSFTIANEDSIDVDLSSNWYQKYYKYASDSKLTASAKDSVFQHNVYGLALVAQNSKKIIPLNASSTRFVIARSQESDTVNVGMAKWAYSLSRSNESYPQHSVPLYSTYESILKFKLDLSNADIESSTISRAELIFYQNDSAMEQSLQSEPSSVQRPPEKNIKLLVGDTTNIPASIDPGSPIFTGSYDQSDGGYHMDITSLAQQISLGKVSKDQQFYIALSNNGVITPSLIYSDSDQMSAKRPKIIITHLKNTNK